MSTDRAPSSPAYGFLTTVDSPTHGLFGGYLLVDPAGRPLEFHCTAPVKVSRAQQILYGATLQGHLHGRQIGATLIAEGSLTPLVSITWRRAPGRGTQMAAMMRDEKYSKCTKMIHQTINTK